MAGFSRPNSAVNSNHYVGLTASLPLSAKHALLTGLLHRLPAVFRQRTAQDHPEME